jgi:hypothetical protein
MDRKSSFHRFTTSQIQKSAEDSENSSKPNSSLLSRRMSKIFALSPFHKRKKSEAPPDFRNSDEVDLENKIRTWMQKSSHPVREVTNKPTSTWESEEIISEGYSSTQRTNGRLNESYYSSVPMGSDDPRPAAEFHASDLATARRSNRLRAFRASGRALNSRNRGLADSPPSPPPQLMQPPRNPWGDELAAWIAPLLCASNCSCGHVGGGQAHDGEAQDGGRIGGRTGGRAGGRAGGR